MSSAVFCFGISAACTSFFVRAVSTFHLAQQVPSSSAQHQHYSGAFLTDRSTSQLPMLASWNAALTCLALGCWSLPTYWNPGAALVSTALQLLVTSGLAVSFLLTVSLSRTFPVLCVLQLIFGHAIYTRLNFSMSHLCYKMGGMPSYRNKDFEKETVLSG